MNAIWNPSPDEQSTYEKEGYCVLRNVISRDEVMMIRGVILNFVLTPETGEAQGAEADPMDPMNTGTAEGRAARFRKLNDFAQKSPVIWHQFYGSPKVLDIVRHFYGDDLVLKFNSAFLKPAKTGAATPWHQDSGLWRDGEVDCFNIWMAIDPATRENGCLQFLPGSHVEPIVPHVEYSESTGKFRGRKSSAARRNTACTISSLIPETLCSGTATYTTTARRIRPLRAALPWRPCIAPRSWRQKTRITRTTSGACEGARC